MIYLHPTKVAQENLNYPVHRLGSRKERMGHEETRRLNHLARVLHCEHGKLPERMLRGVGSR